MEVTTITLDKNVKKKLDKLKFHSRESYNDVLMRILEKNRDGRIDSDSLKETIEILSDPEIMASLARSLDDLSKGRLYSVDEV